MHITSWPAPKPDSAYALQPKLEKLYTVSKKKKRLGADGSSDHELLTVKFRL